MTLIADTGPIIALAKIKRLNILQVLFDQVEVPTTVYKELMAKVGDEVREIDRAFDEFIKISGEYSTSGEIEPVVRDLGKGERSAIELTYAYKKGVLLLIDDKAGREVATRLNLSITGTIGILIKAKSKGELTNVSSALKQMQKNGYWFSDDIIQKAQYLAGE